MRIDFLILEQFRSYPSTRLTWSPGDIELLIGPNGSGKTNVLEAISILSQGRSCLGSEEWDLPSWGTEFYRLTAEITSDATVREKIEVVSQVAPRRAKAAYVNDVRTPVPSIVGRLPTVIFLPQDLHLFGGPPSERRRFLDQILAQVSHDYAEALHDYQRVMKQRNTLLRRIADQESKPSELDTWDGEIATLGSLLTVRRLELIETFGLTLRDEMAALGE
ncbi:MAG TPA: AAA family ATPase, partial [Candidatus Peribacteraceae bacterium]|nr:AAA family ATPase [Candidatus Peribacteraceae bacterium]